MPPQGRSGTGTITVRHGDLTPAQKTITIEAPFAILSATPNPESVTPSDPRTAVTVQTAKDAAKCEIHAGSGGSGSVVNCITGESGETSPEMSRADPSNARSFT